jgi:hypothetical protein
LVYEGFYVREARAMMHKLWQSHTLATNGQTPASRPKRRWRYTVKDVAIIWLVALTLSWLMGLGAVKLIEIIDGILRRNS